MISFGLDIIAKVKATAQIEKEANIDRKALYKALRQDSASWAEMINRVVHALGLK